MIGGSSCKTEILSSRTMASGFVHEINLYTEKHRVIIPRCFSLFLQNASTLIYPKISPETLFPPVQSPHFHVQYT